MVTLLAAAVLPLVAFGLVLIATGAVAPDIGARVLLFMLAIAVVGVLIVGSGDRPGVSSRLSARCPTPWPVCRPAT